MSGITKEYSLLFNGITAANEQLRAVEFQLQLLQRQAEELFLSTEDELPEPAAS